MEFEIICNNLRILHLYIKLYHNSNDSCYQKSFQYIYIYIYSFYHDFILLVYLYVNNKTTIYTPQQFSATNTNFYS